jgi:hypothetical protein
LYMPTTTRLVLHIKKDDEQQQDTHVFDTLSSRKYASPVDAACAAMLKLPRRGISQHLVDAMVVVLRVESSGTADNAQACADFELPEHALLLQNVTMRGALQEAAAAFRVCDKWLSTPLRCVRAVAHVDGMALELLALVYTTSQPNAGRPTLHFLGTHAGQLVNLQTLQLGKRTAGTRCAGNVSHFLRRSEQIQLHAAAMRDVFLEIDKTCTKRQHSLLLDAYVSSVWVNAQEMQCVSLFL